MHTKLLPAVAAVGVVVLAGEAGAALPPGTHYNSGMTGYLPRGVLETSTNQVHVIFHDGATSDTADWQPVPNVLNYLGNVTKPQDGHRDYAVAAGGSAGQLWSYPTNSWSTLSGAVGPASVWDNRVVWSVWSTITGDMAVNLQVLPFGLSGTFLAGNGRNEDYLSLYQNRVAYHYWTGSSFNLAVYQFGTGELHHVFNGHSPDLYGDQVAYVSGSNIQVDTFAGTLPSFTITPPAGCTAVFDPKFAGNAQWIAYAAKCTGGSQLWVRDVVAGTDHYLGTVAGSDSLHAGPNWIAWSDSSFVVRAFIWGGGGGGTVPGDYTGSGYKGNDPAIALDSSGKWHALFTDHSATIDWVPGNTPQTVGKPMRSYAGRYSMGVAEFLGKIVAYDIDTQTWNGIGTGDYPVAYKDLAVWSHRYTSPDFALGWSIGFYPSASGLLFDSDPYDDTLPSLWGKIIAFEHHNGIDQDVYIADVSGAVLHTITGTSHQRQPDIVYDGLAYVDDTLGLRYRKDWSNPTTDVPVPLPSGCAGARLPRVGYKGNWVLFEAYGCNGGTTSELYVIDMTGSQILHFVGRVAPPRGFTPQYAITADQIVFVDGSTWEVIHVDVDATLI